MRTVQTSNLFSLAEGERLKAEGMAAAAEGALSLLQIAQAYAKKAASRREDRTASADDVYEALEENSLPIELGAAAGSLFRGEEWVFTGLWIKSTRKTNHSRMIRQWRLK